MSTKTVVSSFGTISDEELKNLKKVLRELSDVFTMQESQREVIKEIVNAAHDELKIPKKLIKKMAKVYHQHNYTSVIAENEDFELLYEGVVSDSQDQ